MRFVIAGTFVHHSLGAIAYGKMLDVLGADLITLPRLGLGSLNQSVEHVAEILERYDGPAALIGHSQGGCVAVGVANAYPHLVDGVVTIGAPLAGCYLAPSWVPVPAVRDMSAHSGFLSRLYGNEDMLCVSLGRDVVVRPRSAAALLNAANHTFERLTHTGAIFADDLLDYVDRFLDGGLLEEAA